VFHQLLTPVHGSLPLSFLVAIFPLVTVLVTLGVLRRPAWQASLAGLAVGLAVAMGVWRFPPAMALAAVASGATFAAWPLMWIVLNAILLYNVAVVSGCFAALRDWVLAHLITTSGGRWSSGPSTAVSCRREPMRSSSWISSARSWTRAARPADWIRPG
jgi:hypothetical protein